MSAMLCACWEPWTRLVSCSTEENCAICVTLWVGSWDELSGSWFCISATSSCRNPSWPRIAAGFDTDVLDVAQVLRVQGDPGDGLARAHGHTHGGAGDVGDVLHPRPGRDRHRGGVGPDGRLRLYRGRGRRRGDVRATDNKRRRLRRSGL